MNESGLEGRDRPQRERWAKLIADEITSTRNVGFDSDHTKISKRHTITKIDTPSLRLENIKVQ